MPVILKCESSIEAILLEDSLKDISEFLDFPLLVILEVHPHFEADFGLLARLVHDTEAVRLGQNEEGGGGVSLVSQRDSLPCLVCYLFGELVVLRENGDDELAEDVINLLLFVLHVIQLCLDLTAVFVQRVFPSWLDVLLEHAH